MTFLAFGNLAEPIDLPAIAQEDVTAVGGAHDADNAGYSACEPEFEIANDDFLDDAPAQLRIEAGIDAEPASFPNIAALGDRPSADEMRENFLEHEGPVRGVQARRPSRSAGPIPPDQVIGGWIIVLVIFHIVNRGNFPGLPLHDTFVPQPVLLVDGIARKEVVGANRYAVYHSFSPVTELRGN